MIMSKFLFIGKKRDLKMLPYRKKKQGVRIMLGTGDDWYGGSVSAFLCYKCSIVLITDIAKKT